MESVKDRKLTAIHLRASLVERLRVEARRENLSLNSLVETLLQDALERKPNPETLAAIEEARRGEYAGTLDVSSFDAFMKSVNAID